ncbi:Hypothetical predicted protein [Pelobates cultripes]|nr:Hypothetical predicted protein [Pelobates cultripes]
MDRGGHPGPHRRESSPYRAQHRTYLEARTTSRASKMAALQSALHHKPCMPADENNPPNHTLTK